MSHIYTYNKHQVSCKHITYEACGILQEWLLELCKSFKYKACYHYNLKRLCQYVAIYNTIISTLCLLSTRTSYVHIKINEKS